LSVHLVNACLTGVQVAFGGKPFDPSRPIHRLTAAAVQPHFTEIPVERMVHSALQSD